MNTTILIIVLVRSLSGRPSLSLHIFQVVELNQPGRTWSCLVRQKSSDVITPCVADANDRSESRKTPGISSPWDNLLGHPLAVSQPVPQLPRPLRLSSQAQTRADSLISRSRSIAEAGSASSTRPWRKLIGLVSSTCGCLPCAIMRSMS